MKRKIATQWTNIYGISNTIFIVHHIIYFQVFFHGTSNNNKTRIKLMKLKKNSQRIVTKITIAFNIFGVVYIACFQSLCVVHHIYPFSKKILYAFLLQNGINMVVNSGAHYCVLCIMYLNSSTECVIINYTVAVLVLFI